LALDYGNQLVGASPQLPQSVSDLIRSQIEFLVGEGAIARNDGGFVRSRRDFLSKQFLQQYIGNGCLNAVSKGLLKLHRFLPSFLFIGEALQ
jgi:hypothetical protein